jgi:PAS domain S-box-containing protein
MELIVMEIERHSNKKLKIIIFVEIILALISLAFIYYEFKKIIIPILKKLIQNEMMLQSANDVLIESENKLRAVFDSTKDITLLISHDYKVINFNKMAYEIGLLHLKKEFKVGVDIRDYFFEEDLNLVNTHLPRILQGEQFVFDIERTIDGAKIWFEVTYSPVYDSKDKILGCNINLKDITERTTNLDKILKQNEVLKKIAWQQSHEVRRPVANILGLVDLIKNHKITLTEEMQDKTLDLLIASATELDEIVRSIVKKTSNINKE